MIDFGCCSNNSIIKVQIYQKKKYAYETVFYFNLKTCLSLVILKTLLCKSVTTFCIYFDCRESNK